MKDDSDVKLFHIFYVDRLYYRFNAMSFIFLMYVLVVKPGLLLDAYVTQQEGSPVATLPGIIFAVF